MLKDTNHNQLIIRIQPNEAVRLKMNAKQPGLELRTVETELDLTYKHTVEDPDIPEAYEALLLDAFKGDYSESVSEQELEASWKIFTPLLHELEGNKDIQPAPYVYGLSSHLDIDIVHRLTRCRRLGRSRWPRRLCSFISVPEVKGF